MATATAINWPQKFLPGTTDNFVSNEVIATGVSASQIWALLSNVTTWESYYDNVSHITPPKSGPILSKTGEGFSFTTFGLPLSCTLDECVKPAPGTPGRLAWHAWREGHWETGVDVYHAWVVEDIDGGRVRILTQESQIIGKHVAWLTKMKPNPMLNKHQDWCEGLVKAAREKAQ